MFDKILIANRGEIALRIIRTCRELGIRSVAVYSEADAESLHVGLADESICIGPAISAQSYLNSDAILEAGQQTGSTAVHPGYGYLAEKAAFAQACEDNGMVFIGPRPENLQLAGDKINAKEIMQRAGVPTIPSSPGGIVDKDEACKAAHAIGYPIMIKASGGGGGRGIRICHNDSELLEEYPIARMEARAAFGNDEVYLEKYISKPRHIEFQVLADQDGRTVHLGERECTIQRRYQKLIEEAPSPRLSPKLRQAMGATAIKAAEAVNYLNAGTVEFLVDDDDNFYFMEINARIQVEHPVTELTTGIDLVKEQIRLATGAHLAYTFEDINLRGWALECRINAEDPERNFLPSPGVIETYRPPGGFGIRLDTHLYQGYELPVFYDSLIAKLITFDLDRPGAIQVMRRALDEFRIEPIKTTIPLYRQVMLDEDFVQGDFDTGFVRRYAPDDEDD
jgi:acetyl-CoA carboxylase biotin carboxylase subunit